MEPSKDEIEKARKAIRDYIKANGYKRGGYGYIKPARPKWGSSDFKLAMWLGTATAIACVAGPIGVLAFPVLGMLNSYYEEKDKEDK